jgi:hypothetical protein
VRVASGGGGRDGAGAEHGRALQEVRRRPGHVAGHVIGPGHVIGHVIAPCHVVGHVIGPGHVILAAPAHLFSGGGKMIKKVNKNVGGKRTVSYTSTIIHIFVIFLCFRKSQGQ